MFLTIIVLKKLKKMRKKVYQLKQVVDSHLIIVKLSFYYLNDINMFINNH